MVALSISRNAHNQLASLQTLRLLPHSRPLSGGHLAATGVETNRVDVVLYPVPYARQNVRDKMAVSLEETKRVPLIFAFHGLELFVLTQQSLFIQV